MPLSYYDLIIPTMISRCEILCSLMDKAAAFADSKAIPHSELINARLIEDMEPFKYQIQRVSDTCKGAVTRGSNGSVSYVSWPDDETSFPDLKARLTKTIEFLRQVPRDALEGEMDDEVVYVTPGGDKYPFTRYMYWTTNFLPNFYFHVVTAYDLLRHMGVPIGKLHYLGVS